MSSPIPDDDSRPVTPISTASPAGPFLLAQRSLALLAGVALVGGLKLAQAAVVPVLFALFIALLLSPTVEYMVRRHVPRAIAAAVVMIALLAIVGGSLNATWKPARVWPHGQGLGCTGG